jgi:alkylation response protein AidB-like acyl-CoA dehydrogenase
MVLQGWGDDYQKEEYLPKTCSGRYTMAFALTEPLAGSDPSSMITKFEDKGDHFLLNGKKYWIGNGTHANVLTTYAKESGGIHHGKISAFVVDGDSRGITRREIRNKVGLLSIENAEINFDNCRVPKKNMLGLRGDGLNIAYSALIDGRLSVAAGSIGVMKDCLEESIRYSKMRKQHDSPLAKKQLIQRHLSTILVNIESSRWLVYRAAIARQILHDYVERLKNDYNQWLFKLNRSNKVYCKLRSEADLLAAMAKLHASNSAFDSANRSLQIFGSSAYIKNNRIARHFLDSRATTIYEGTNEVLQLKIASKVLGDKYEAY